MAHARRYFTVLQGGAADGGGPRARRRWRSSGSSMGSSGRPTTGNSMRPHGSGCGRSRRCQSWRGYIRTCKRNRRRRCRRARSVETLATRAPQLGRPDALRRRRTAQDRQQRGRAGATTDRVGPQELAVCGRSGSAPNRDSVFAGADLQARADESPRLSARRDRTRIDASGAARLGTDASLEAPAPGFRRTSCLNGALPIGKGTPPPENSAPS